MEEKYTKFVDSLDNIIGAVYNILSGNQGKPIDWDLFKHLFHKDAKLIPSGKRENGEISCRYLSPEEYISSSRDFLETNSFFEKEVHRITETFGTLTHVFSTYESRKHQDDDVPFTRGINSIQLLFDSRRWWIINIYWTNENDINVLTARYTSS
ncbi:hypothetical protein [Fulvivirga ligni]|uniref:hypothetical protein n=1 Tax=Fulvivirga ligni TaxID=2904246 RepID=UPI001F417FE5|nr:hypothetical protein [Fulvivirga ligni]UII20109.1 hypothetical protein LVD16_19880 [Fulvivirga ligni]